eukprot:GHVN01060293.1.p1 GENE.GHVN01060293.1~~GHVN01060293.1.p1  ORF type:complete len:146 (-),score=16.60 GHVN01060293.1:905-1342(-)
MSDRQISDRQMSDRQMCDRQGPLSSPQLPLHGVSEERLPRIPLRERQDLQRYVPPSQRDRASATPTSSKSNGSRSGPKRESSPEADLRSLGTDAKPEKFIVEGRRSSIPREEAQGSKSRVDTGRLLRQALINAHQSSPKSQDSRG